MKTSKNVTKFAMLALAFCPFVAIADKVPMSRHIEAYLWSKGEVEGYCILVASVMVGICILVGVLRKWRKRIVGVIVLGIAMTAAIFYMSICHACGGKGRSVGQGERMYDRFPDLFGAIDRVYGEIKIGKICKCCRGVGFHLPWGKGCVDNEIEHSEFFELERSNPNRGRCSRCGYEGYLPTHKCGEGIYGAQYSE